MSKKLTRKQAEKIVKEARERDERPNLREVELIELDLRGIDLKEVDLFGAKLSGVYLGEAELFAAKLYRANFSEADLAGANLSETNLQAANLHGANLTRAKLNGAYLFRADLSKADLSRADLSRAYLDKANLQGATVGYTTIGNVDLSAVKGLDTVKHQGPSYVDIHTLYRSEGKIPESFLRGIGTPDSFITYITSLTSQVIQYYSCFISYASQDQPFAQRLHADLQQQGVRCWFAPEDIAGGKKIYPQIDQAIRLHDKLLLVLSEHSLQSEWVITEIRRALRAEIRDKRRKLFPIRLVDWELLKAWECFDADTGKDLAVEVREYFIPDFTRWKDHDTYQKALEHLLRDLKAEE